MKDNKLDWFSAVMFNPGKDYAHFTMAGYDDTNVKMFTPEEYKKAPSFQKMFTDESGNFNDKAFNAKYTEALHTFNEFISGNTQNKYFRAYEGTIRNPYAEKVVNPTIEISMIDNPFGVSSGLVGINKASAPIESAREIAQRSNVVDSSTNKQLSYTPNDFFSSMFGSESLVEAKWDKNGTHTDSWGNEVVHNKGDWKTIDGKPYYETLGKQDSSGKNFLKWQDVLTTDGSFMNNLDFFDADGLEKSIAGQTVKTIAIIGSLFVPYLGPALMAAGIAGGLAELYATFSKSGMEAFSDGDVKDSKAWQFSNQMSGWLKRFDSAQSDEALENTWGYENITNIVSDLVGQVKEQKFLFKSISSVPKLLKGSDKKLLDQFILKNKNTEIGSLGKTLEKAIKDGDVTPDMTSIKGLFGVLPEFQKLEQATATASKIGREIGSAYMALIQTPQVYESLKSNGFDSSTVFAGTVASAIGFMAITRGPLGALVNSTYGPEGTKKVLTPIIKDVVTKAANATAPLVTKAGKINFIKRAVNGIVKKADDIWNANGEFGVKGYIAGMLTEGAEEVSEEILQDTILQGSKYLEESLESINGFKTKNTYDFSTTNLFDRYTMAFFGGVVGGGLFKAGEHYENYDVIKAAAAASKLSTYDMNHLVSSIAQFGVDRVVKEINTQLDKGGLLSDKLSTELDESSTKDNIVYKPASSPEESQREIVRTNLLGFVNGVEAYLVRNNLNLDKADVLKGAMGRQLISQFMSNDATEMIYGEYLDLASQKTKLGMQYAAMPEGDGRSTIQKEIKKVDEKLEELLSGANAGKYAEKIAFVNNPELLNAFVNTTVESYSRQYFKKNYIDTTDEEKKVIDASFDKYTKSATSKKDVVTAYKLYTAFKKDFEGISEKFKQNNFSDNSKVIQDIFDEVTNTENAETIDTRIDNRRKSLLSEGNTLDDLITKFSLNPLQDLLSEEQKLSKINDFLRVWVKANPIANKRADNEITVEEGSSMNIQALAPEQQSRLLARIAETMGGNSELQLDAYTYDVLSKYRENLDRIYDARLAEYAQTNDGKDEDGNNLPVTMDNLNDYTLAQAFSGFRNDHSTIYENIVKSMNLDIKNLDTILSRGAVSSDPVYEALSEISKQLYQKDLFAILRTEDDNFSAFGHIENYIIQNLIDLNELYKMKDIINILRVVVSNVSSDADVQSVIDKYGELHGLKTKIHLDDSQLAVLNRSLFSISNQIDFLLTTSENNNAGKLQMDKKTWYNTQSIFVQKAKMFFEDEGVLDAIANAQEDLYNTNEWGEISKEISALSTFANADEGITALNPLIKRIETHIYNTFNGKEDILFNGNVPLLKSSDTMGIATDLSSDTQSDLLFREWLLINAITDPNEFNKKYQKKLIRGNNAPFYSQMFTAKMAYAFVNDADNYFNKFAELNEGKVPSVKNMLYVDGSSGCGKSTMIASYVWDFINDSGKKVWVASNNTISLNNIVSNLDNVTDADSKTKNDIFESIFDGDNKLSEEWETIKTYIKDNRKTIGDSHTSTEYEEYSIQLNGLVENVLKVNTDKLPTFILYDEAGHISFAERDLITRLGIKLVGMGDLTQSSYNIEGTSLDIDYLGQIFRTPLLPVGIRFNNIYIRESNITLHSITSSINVLLDAEVSEDVKINILKDIKKALITKDFSYYQQSYTENGGTDKSEDGGILGTKITEDLIVNNTLTDDYVTMVKNIMSTGKNIVYIRNEKTKNEKFEAYLSTLGVDTVDEVDVQGEQYDYNIINVKYNPINTTSSSLERDSYALNLKSFNTLVGRAKNGNIILMDETLPIKKSIRQYTKPIDVTMNKEELAAYKTFWLDNYFNDTVGEDTEVVLKATEEFVLEGTMVASEGEIKKVSNQERARKQSRRDYKSKVANVQKSKTDKTESTALIDKAINGKTSTIKTSAYIPISDYFKDNFPTTIIDGTETKNWEYYFVNLLMFNDPNEWSDTIKGNSTNIVELNKLLSEHINIDKINDVTIELVGDDIYLSYISNINKEEKIKLGKGDFSFEEPTRILLKNIVVESGGATFLKDANGEILRPTDGHSHNFKMVQKTSGNKVVFGTKVAAGSVGKNDNGGHDVGIYAFVTYNLWENNLDNLVLKDQDKRAKATKDTVDTSFIPNVTAITANPIGRSFKTFTDEWLSHHSFAEWDKLAGLNQSYRLLQVLTTQIRKQSETDPVLKEQLDAFENEIVSTMDNLLIKTVNNPNVNVFANIFTRLTKLSAVAKNKKNGLIFDNIVKYIYDDPNLKNPTNAKIVFEEIKGLLEKVKSGEEGILTSDLANKYPTIIDNITAIAADDSLYKDINTIFDNTIKGLGLSIVNTPINEFADYFQSGLYYSLYGHFMVMNTIVNTLNPKTTKYRELVDALNKLTIAGNSEGLFKDGIWYNYVSYRAGKNNNPVDYKINDLYVSYKSIDTTYYDVDFAPPSVYLRLNENSVKIDENVKVVTADEVTIQENNNIFGMATLEELTNYVENTENTKKYTYKDINIIQSKIFTFDNKKYVAFINEGIIIELQQDIITDNELSINENGYAYNKDGDFVAFAYDDSDGTISPVIISTEDIPTWVSPAVTTPVIDPITIIIDPIMAINIKTKEAIRAKNDSIKDGFITKWLKDSSEDEKNKTTQLWDDAITILNDADLDTLDRYAKELKNEDEEGEVDFSELHIDPKYPNIDGITRVISTLLIENELYIQCQ